MKVLVLGAGGFIGNSVAKAIRREGYRVTGLVRSSAQALDLQKHEIVPVLGDITDLKSYSSHADEASILVDAAGLFDYGLNRKIRDMFAKTVKKGKQKRYVFTSGIMTYGDNPGKIVQEEDTPVSNIGSMQERYEYELEVLRDDRLDGVVVRPGWVYGLDLGRYLDSWFKPNDKGELELVGSLDKRWGWVHVEDLGDAFARIVNAPRALVKGELFDVCDDSRVTYGELRRAFAAASGFKGKIVHRPEIKESDFPGTKHEATSVPAGRKIRRVLGWAPKRASIVDQIDLYYLSFKAHRAKL